jgi:tRNA(Ile)-lysidine synthase
MKKTEQTVISFIKRHDLIQDGDKILVAFSGGPDSVFALNFLNKFKKKYNIQLIALHFNHQLRGNDSILDEKFSKIFCDSLDIKFFSKKLNVIEEAKLNKQSIEEAARELRYKYLTSFTHKYKCNKIITAHNQSDNTETVLLNLCSGSGVAGISGIPIRRGNIIRPFLCLSKNEIITYLNKHSIEYCSDLSNNSSEFKRNFLRNEIIPKLKDNLNPSLDAAVFRTTNFLLNVNGILNQVAAFIIRKEITYSKNNFDFPVRLISDFDQVTGGLLLREAIKKIGVEISSAEIDRLLKLAVSQKGKRVLLSGKLIAFREEDRIAFSKTDSRNENTVDVIVGMEAQINSIKLKIEEIATNKNKVTRGRNEELVDASKLNQKFIVRPWRDGDFFYPLGMKNKKKVSDFLTDQKIAAAKKKESLVLLNGDNIVWVVGFRIDDRFKITDQTEKIYKLRIG